MNEKTKSPIRVHPYRDQLSGKVFHVRVSLVWDDIRRFEVCLRKPLGGVFQKKSRRNSWRGLESFNEQYFGEQGGPVPADNGVAIEKYRREIIATVWAIIREGEQKEV